MDKKTKQLNLDTYNEGLKRLADQMSGMAHDAFTAYLDGMGVTYTAAEAAEWLASLCIEYLLKAEDQHTEVHGDETCTESEDRPCFCGVIEHTIRSSNMGCPIARFVHREVIMLDEENSDITMQ